MKDTRIFNVDEIRAIAFETLEKLYLDYDLEVAQHGFIALSQMVKVMTKEQTGEIER